MRHDFIDGLIELARSDSRILLISADLGFGTIEPFVEAFPDRFFNVGVAEQGMIALATGLARKGFTPYCYSIAAFAVGRTWEFLRNGPVAHGIAMGLVGIGPGFDYGADGHTHHALEDVALMRTLPRAKIYCPADAQSARSLGIQPIETGRLTYFRLARNGPPCSVPRLSEVRNDQFSGSIMVTALGDAWPRALAIRDSLELAGVQAFVSVVEELGPDLTEQRLQSLSSFSAIITVESHQTRGGLAEAAAMQLTRIGWPGRILPVGISELPMGNLGDNDYLWRVSTRDTSEIINWCKEVLNGT